MISRALIGFIGAGGILAACVVGRPDHDPEMRRENAGGSVAAQAKRGAHESRLSTQVATRMPARRLTDPLSWNAGPQPESPRSRPIAALEQPRPSIRRIVLANDAFFGSADAEPLPVDAIEIVEGLDPNDVLSLFQHP